MLLPMSLEDVADPPLGVTAAIGFELTLTSPPSNGSIGPQADIDRPGSSRQRTARSSHE